MQLHYREYGERSDTRPSLLLLHGLFGSSANWQGIARKLEGRLHIVSPDLRNHGRSPHDPIMDYPAMAADVLGLMDDMDLQQPYLVGHSMGGKAAMWLTLQYPERVSGLVPVDMAPVSYGHSFDNILSALESLDLSTLANRNEADLQLVKRLETPGLRAYLLQNLARQDGAWAWRINLPVLRVRMADILGFPPAAGKQFTGDTLFIHGGKSDYLSPAHAQTARELFPFARMRAVPEAGHWVYSEAPAEFLAALTPFLLENQITHPPFRFDAH